MALTLTNKIGGPLDVRRLARMSVATWADRIVGVPATGPVHRPIYVSNGDRAPIKCEVIEPVGTGPFPVMLFVHGGGWVMGDLDSHHQLALRFAEQGFVVVALEYALMPEEPFPAGYDDVVTVGRWIGSNIGKFHGDPARLVAFGDSAGGNLAAAVAVNQPELGIKAAALVYGVYDMAALPYTPAVHAEDYIRNMHEAYLGKGNLHLLKDPRVSPILKAQDLPPSIVAVGSEDPLHETSGQFVERLGQLGVEHEYLILEGHNHGFLHFEDSPEVLPAIAKMSRFLKKYV